MARFCPLFSSSSGNCTYIGGSGGGILIDAGCSAKQTELALASIGVRPESLGALFITHEHTDHIKGIKVFAARYNLPVYASKGTLAALREGNALAPSTEGAVIPASGVEVNGMFIRPFRTPHDSRESTGYTVLTADSKRVAVATDMGKITDEIMNVLYGCDLVLLESNHDINMLRTGPYPYYLKQRILSDYGHLSNDLCAETAAALLEGGTTRFFLGHLSKENNFPDLALQTTRAAMTVAGARENVDYLLSVAGCGAKLVTL